MPSRYVLVATIVCSVLAAGCDESLESVAGPTPALAPTFTSIQRDIFQAADSSGRPSCASCHNPGNPFVFRQVGMDLSGDNSYASLVGVASREQPGMQRVAPGDPANSYVVQKLEGGAGITGLRMPSGGPYLSAGQIAIIKRWIELGARRD